MGRLQNGQKDVNGFANDERESIFGLLPIVHPFGLFGFYLDTLPLIEMYFTLQRTDPYP